MENPENEIGEAIVSGNFSLALQLSENWLRSIPLKGDPSEERVASDAYRISRFFLHRHDRVSKIPAGREKAALFRGYIKEFQDSNEAEGVRAEKVARAAVRYCHAQISAGLAKDFAGQKAYQLDQKEIIQLGISLVEIGNIESALETFQFLLQMNPKSAEVNFLMSYCYEQLQKPHEMHKSLRIALAQRPELASLYNDYLPAGIFRSLYQELNENSDILRDRYYALLLEVNGFYKSPWRLRDTEIDRFYSDYKKYIREYEANPRLQEELRPRILHILCILISANHEIRNHDMVEELREKMVEIDKSLWEAFQQKNLL